MRAAMAARRAAVGTSAVLGETAMILIHSVRVTAMVWMLFRLD
jgi:hypothetical protein